MSEAYRVLAPGGLAYVQTTNRLQFTLFGKNLEYGVRYFNWLPPVVKEAFVHHHLHYDPGLAHFTPRPAVHWFSYADLCALGRTAGFHQFYAKFDMLNHDDLKIAARLAATQIA